jgi:hypothetical protein
MLKTVAIADLKPNPFRRLDEYPILREKVDALTESIDATGFWGTIVARPKGREFEIAFGHHRLVALQEGAGGKKQVEIIVRDLTNEDMLKMMARENMEEWGTSAWVELETIRSVIDAYGKGEIELPEVGKRGPRIETSLNSAKFYTRGSIAQFLGWTKRSGDRLEPNFACETAFRALNMINAEFLEESDLKHLSRKQMAELVTSQWGVYQDEIRVAKDNQQEAEAASKRAKQAETPQERLRFEKQASIHQEQAQQHKEAAKEKAKDFGKEAAAMYQRGHGFRDVRKRAEELKPAASPKTKIHDVDEFASRIARKLENIANDDDDLSGDISNLKAWAGDLSPRALKSLSQSFTALIGRLERMQASIEKAFNTSRSHFAGTGVLHDQKAIAQDSQDGHDSQDR